MKIKSYLLLSLFLPLLFACSPNDDALGGSSQPANATPDATPSASGSGSNQVTLLMQDPNMIGYAMAMVPILDNQSIILDPNYVSNITTARGFLVSNYSPFYGMTPEDISSTIGGALNSFVDDGFPGSSGSPGGNTAFKSKFEKCKDKADVAHADRVAGGEQVSRSLTIQDRAYCGCCDMHNKTQADDGCSKCTKLPEG